MPVGPGGSFALDNRFDVGVQVRLPDLAGDNRDSTMRALIARAAIQL